MSVGSVISIALSAGALIIAIWAAFESHRANRRSAEANQIAERANTLAEQSNEHADKANLISAQALELAEREAPAPLSELVYLDKHKISPAARLSWWRSQHFRMKPSNSCVTHRFLIR